MVSLRFLVCIAITNLNRNILNGFRTDTSSCRTEKYTKQIQGKIVCIYYEVNTQTSGIPNVSLNTLRTGDADLRF